MVKKEYLQGLIAAPFTPMSKNGSVNISVIPAYYEMLKANGVTGAFICGSTGEGASLTTNEKKAVAEAWASCTASDDGFKVMTFLGGTSIAECQDLAKHANKIGLYAVSFTSPYYFKPANVDILARICMDVAETVPDMPFYYYHIPALNGANFKMIELIKILDDKLPNFFGIKYTHEDFMDFLSCLNFGNGKYNMLWGRDENMLSALILGAKGSVGSTFNYAAPLYRQLMSAFDLGDFANARKLQLQSIDMISLLGKYGGMATGKAYMKLIGLDCGEFRLPIKNMAPEEFDLFKSDSEEINFKTFASRVPSVASS